MNKSYLLKYLLLNIGYFGISCGIVYYLFFVVFVDLVIANLTFDYSHSDWLIKSLFGFFFSGFPAGSVSSWYIYLIVSFTIFMMVAFAMLHGTQRTYFLFSQKLYTTKQ